MNYAQFKEELKRESVYPATPEIFNWIINSGELIELKKNEILIDYDVIDDSIYCICDGIIRGTNINKLGVERTTGFASCGTLLFASQCFTLRRPSNICFSACCRTVVLKIPKSVLDAHIDEDHLFCRWFMGVLSIAVCYRDMRDDGHNGDALEKYKWMYENRPEIINHVSNKIIASYLNISEVHLSRIRKQILKDE